MSLRRRPPRQILGATVAVLVLVACGGCFAGARSSAATAPGRATATTTTGSGRASTVGAITAQAASLGDWPEFDYDRQRSGVGPAETGITSSDLGSLTLRTVRIDGIADSSAVAQSNVEVDGARHELIAVTTSYGKTIAIDPSTGRKLWEFDPSGVNSTPGNPQVTTASPVIDPDGRFLYAASPNGFIHKLSIATGAQVWATKITYDPVHEKIASALNISGKWVVATTGGYIGDIPPYDGHVVTISRATGRIVHVWNSECSRRHRLIRASSCSVTNTHGDDAIWGRSGAVIEPGTHRILVATGNGPFNGRDNWGDSVLELSPNAARLLHNWTPRDQARLDANDVDLGSTSPAILPLFHHRRLAVQAGKAGVVDLLNLGRLDGTSHGAGPRLGGEVGQVSAPGDSEVLTEPAVWSAGSTPYVFIANDSGTMAYRLIEGARRPRLVLAWQDSASGTSPVVAGGLLYVYDELGGHLDIRNPRTGALLRSLPVGQGHWNSPIVISGLIIEPTGSYHNSSSSSTIDIYHLPGH